MRYMITDSPQEKVGREEEVDYLNNFIELQKIRLTDKVDISFITEGDLSAIQLEPLLLIPFVENAFKHGDKAINSPGIRIHLVVSPHKLVFEIINHVKKNFLGQKDKIGGIGLQNIKRRLEILYPGKYTLETTQENDLYRVNLSILT